MTGLARSIRQMLATRRLLGLVMGGAANEMVGVAGELDRIGARYRRGGRAWAALAISVGAAVALVTGLRSLAAGAVLAFVVERCFHCRRQHELLRFLACVTRERKPEIALALLQALASNRAPPPRTDDGAR